jgi:hypothetical protein
MVLVLWRNVVKLSMNYVNFVQNGLKRLEKVHETIVKDVHNNLHEVERLALLLGHLAAFNRLNLRS